MNYGVASKHAKLAQGYNVSGTCDLPEGYGLAYVPPNAMVEPTMPEVELGRIFQSSYSLASSVISIVQILSACSALYQSRGYQITAYGYAAFGFTVTPYLVMSFLNLLANCLNPTYPNVYLVQTEIMDEAVSRGGHFTDIVGKLESESLLVEDLSQFSAILEQREDQMFCQIGDTVLEDGDTEPIPDGALTHEKASENSIGRKTPILTSASTLSEVSSPQTEEALPRQEVQVKHDGDNEQPPSQTFKPTLLIPGCYKFKLSYANTSSTSILHRRKHYHTRAYLSGALTMAVASLPFIPMGIMSKFQPGGSTVSQRAWIMSWYAAGIVSVQNPYFTDEVIEYSYYGTRRLIETWHGYSRVRQASYVFQRLASSLTVLVPLAPAIGGFVVVGQMLISYGSCTGL